MSGTDLSQAKRRRQVRRKTHAEAATRTTVETVGGTAFAFAMGFVLAMMLHLGGSMPMPVVYGLFLGTLFAVIAAVALIASDPLHMEMPEAATSARLVDTPRHAVRLVAHTQIIESATRSAGSHPDSAWMAVHMPDSSGEDDIYLDENGRRELPPQNRRRSLF